MIGYESDGPSSAEEKRGQEYIQARIISWLSDLKSPAFETKENLRASTLAMTKLLPSYDQFGSGQPNPQIYHIPTHSSQLVQPNSESGSKARWIQFINRFSAITFLFFF